MRGAFFVILGASLWATDTLFRHPLSQDFSAVTLVLIEHAIAFLVSLLFVLYWHRKKLRSLFLPWRPMLGIAFIGILGSALATICFTNSFQYIDPTITILLQKTQPLWVMLLSSLFLSEKLPRSFWVFAVTALVSSYYLSFPSGFSFSALRSADLKGVILALVAASFWAKSTVIARSVLRDQYSSSLVTFWRFTFGLLTLIAIHLISSQSKIDLHFALDNRSVLQSLAFMAIIPGLMGVGLYYRGLSMVSATRATLLELSFPLCAIFINSYYLGTRLETIQWIAALGLFGSIAAITFLSQSQAHYSQSSPSDPVSNP